MINQCRYCNHPPERHAWWCVWRSEESVERAARQVVAEWAAISVDDLGFKMLSAAAASAPIYGAWTYDNLVRRIMDLLATREREARRQGMEEAAKVAEEQCQYITRLCSPKHEEICRACFVAASIRDRAQAEEGK